MFSTIKNCQNLVFYNDSCLVPQGRFCQDDTHILFVLYNIIYIYTYILLVYSPFSDRVGLLPHKAQFPEVLMKSIGTVFF